jgi:hypothetical protein
VRVPVSAALLAGDLHVQAGAHRRSHPRSAAVSCVGPQPRHRRDRLLELDLHRRRRRPPSRNRRTRTRRIAGTHFASGLGPYRLFGRLPVGPRSRDGDRAPTAQRWADEHGGMISSEVRDAFSVSAIQRAFVAMTSERRADAANRGSERLCFYLAMRGSDGKEQSTTMRSIAQALRITTESALTRIADQSSITNDM